VRLEIAGLGTVPEQPWKNLFGRGKVLAVALEGEVPLLHPLLTFDIWDLVFEGSLVEFYPPTIWVSEHSSHAHSEISPRAELFHLHHHLDLEKVHSGEVHH